MRCRVAVLLFAALWRPAVAAGQTTTATLQGVVRDASRAVLPGVTVTLRDADTGFVRTTTTDGAGAYVLPYIPAGTYELTIELPGFRTQKRERLRFEVGQQLTIDASLDVAGVAETVTVREAAPVVETTKSAVDMVVTREQIDSLPLPGRQASSLALLSAGVVQRGTDSAEPVTTGGQPRGSGEMLVDGVSNELMATNSIRSNAPPDAIQEFQVITSQYQAEFGNASGVILNTITRSGTNDLHGRAYYFHRDEALDSRNFFQTSKAAFEQKQPGGWLGGPIARDRTHYFATYEATRRMQIATVTSPVAPGDVEQPFENNQFLAKVTHQINKANRVTGRFNVDRPTRENVGVGGFTLQEVGIKQLTQDLVYLGEVASILSNRSLNEARVQVSFERSQLDPNRPDVFTIIRPSSTSGKSSNVPQTFTERRVQLVDNYSYERINHRIKVGIDVNRVTLAGFVFQNIPGVFQFATDRPFNAADSTTYPVSFIGNAGDTNFRMVTTGVSAFAQDAWRLPRNVTLNLGVRDDGWSVTGIDLQKGNVAPRLAFAWDPWGTNKTAIRGGFGVFYNNVITNETLFTSFLANQRSVVISNPGYPDPFVRGTSIPQTLSTYVAQVDQPLPRAYQATAGFQHEVVSGVSVGADYVNSRGRNLIRIVDTNPVTPPTFTRPDPTRGFVRRLEGTGYSDYHGLLVTGKSRLSNRGVVQASYTIASYKTTTEAENALPQQDDFNIDDSYGNGNFDQRHRAVVSGYATLPLDIQVGGVLAARSALPFNITTGRDNLYQPFEGTAGRQTMIRVNSTPSLEGSRLVTVVPVASDEGLRTRAWVEKNRRLVDTLSKGRLAYVWLPNTATPGYTAFNRYYYAQQDKDGVVIDERFNQGGMVADYIVNEVDRKLMGYFARRDGKPSPSPAAGIYGPKVMIINESAGSGGNALPYYFKQRQIGPLVGTRTWGGLVGTLGVPTTIDGGGITAPSLAFYDLNGRWAIENEGVAPDIEVENTPAAENAGHDLQLERAVQEALKILEQSPVKRVPRPAPANRTSGRGGR